MAKKKKQGTFHFLNGSNHKKKKNNKKKTHDIFPKKFDLLGIQKA